MRGWEPIAEIGRREPCVLGVRLVPITLGHLHVLADCGIEAGDDWSAAEQKLAVFICSRPAAEARSNLSAWWIRRVFRLWGWRNRKRDWVEELGQFSDWFSAQLGGPITKSKSQRSALDFGAPFQMNLLACAMGSLGLSRAEALSMTVREVRQLLVALGEAEGTVKPWTRKDETLDQLAQKWEREALEKEQAQPETNN